jgi:hypothetical protein
MVTSTYLPVLNEERGDVNAFLGNERKERNENQ